MISALSPMRSGADWSGGGFVVLRAGMAIDTFYLSFKLTLIKATKTKKLKNNEEMTTT